MSGIGGEPPQSHERGKNRVPDELQYSGDEKRESLETLTRVGQAMDDVCTGKGEKGKPDEAKTDGLRNARSYIADLASEIELHSLNQKERIEMTTTLSLIKVALAEYLSDEQLVEVFGTDNLA